MAILDVVAASRTIRARVQPILQTLVMELVAASNFENASADLNLAQANSALLCLPQHYLLEEGVNMPLQSPRHMHALQLRVVSAVCLDDSEPRSRWSQLCLRLHDEFPHAIKKLHSEIGQSPNKGIVRIGAHQHVGAINPFQLLHLPLNRFSVWVASKFHVQQNGYLRVHNRLRHLHMSQRVRQSHHSPNRLILHFLFEFDSSLLLLLSCLTACVDLVHHFLHPRLVASLLLFLFCSTLLLSLCLSLCLRFYSSLLLHLPPLLFLLLLLLFYLLLFLMVLQVVPVLWWCGEDLALLL